MLSFSRRFLPFNFLHQLGGLFLQFHVLFFQRDQPALVIGLGLFQCDTQLLFLPGVLAQELMLRFTQSALFALGGDAG